MATDNTLIVSGSNFVPNTTLATSSLAAFTSSMLGGSGPFTLIVSSSLYTGSISTRTGSQGASGSLAAITGSIQAANTFATLLVNFQTSTGSSGGGGSFTAVTYVMSGFFLATQTRETWSGPSINTPPPTGHTLVDIVVMGSYPPQNSAT